MSFYSNFHSDHIPGPLTGNPLNGLCEKVCIQAQRIFDACIKQTQLENYIITLKCRTPANPTPPLTFISARSTSSEGQVKDLSVERLPDKDCGARVHATIVIPIEVAYVDANGVEGVATSSISVTEDVLLNIPAPSIIPYRITAVVSAVLPSGTYNADGTFTVNCCITVILKVAMDVELLLPTYGYCAIPPAQEFSQEICSGFFELPLYPGFK